MCEKIGKSGCRRLRTNEKHPFHSRPSNQDRCEVTGTIPAQKHFAMFWIELLDNQRTFVVKS